MNIVKRRKWRETEKKSLGEKVEGGGRKVGGGREGRDMEREGGLRKRTPFPSFILNVILTSMRLKHARGAILCIVCTKFTDSVQNEYCGLHCNDIGNCATFNTTFMVEIVEN